MAALSVWLIDSHSSIERGGAVQCASLARGLADRGHDVRCFFEGIPGTKPAGAAFEHLLRSGAAIEFVQMARPASVLDFRRRLRERPPAVLHTHKNRALHFLHAATLGRRRPPWLANRGTVYPLGRNPLAAWIHRRALDCVIPVAHAVGRALVADGVPAEKVEVVYGSVDPERFDPARAGGARESVRAAWQIPEDAPTIGMLASLKTPKKGHVDLLRAVSRLASEFPDLRLVLMGEGETRALRELANRLDIESRIVFPGFVENIPEALSGVDVVVCASLRGEGLTGALREALCMERPVVSTDVAGNGEMVRNGQTGRLVPPGDPAALAAAIADQLRDREGAARMARAGRAWVLENCSDAVRAERVEAIYRRLLTERRCHGRSTAVPMVE